MDHSRGPVTRRSPLLLGHPADPRRPARRTTVSSVADLLRSLWRLPAPPDARPTGRLDVALVGVVAVLAVVEATLLRPDLHLHWVALATLLAWLPTLLVRRTQPLLMAAVFALVTGALMVVGWVSDGRAPDDLNTAVVALLIPYSLTRWARGRDAVVGMGLFLLVAVTSLITQALVPADRIGGSAVVVTAAAIGVALRSRSQLRSRQLDDVRQLERERLARDLHDTVAHHLTAIAISAQAGLAVADSTARGGHRRAATDRRGGQAHAGRDAQGGPDAAHRGRGARTGPSTTWPGWPDPPAPDQSSRSRSRRGWRTCPPPSPPPSTASPRRRSPTPAGTPSTPRWCRCGCAAGTTPSSCP